MIPTYPYNCSNLARSTNYTEKQFQFLAPLEDISSSISTKKKKRESFHSGARFPEAALVSRQPIDRLYFRLPLRKEERGARSSVAGHACIELAGQRAT